MLGTYCDIQEALRRFPYIPPPSVADVSRNDDMVDVVLRDRDYAAEQSSCDEAHAWLLSLGAQQNVIQLAAKLGGSSIAPEVMARAEKDNLAIIDWGAAPQLHGRKVLSVAEFVLQKVLKRPELVDDKYLQYVDLDPSDKQNGMRLQRYVAEYKLNYHKDTNKTLPEQRFRDATDWIKNRGKLDPQLRKRMINLRDNSSGDVQSYGDSFPVDQIVLEAVLAHFLLRPDGHAWAASLSFSVNWVPDFTRAWSNFNSMIVTAAVNDRSSEPPGEFPQGLNPAANFVTVTTGTRDGLVLGGYSLFGKQIQGKVVNDPAVPVHVLAPGCGYEYELIEASDFGTSFATPFVAAFTWAEHLANGTESQRARDTLIGSSEMRLREIPISSMGVFEPAFIAAGSGSWYAKYDPSLPASEPAIVPIAGGSIQINYVDETETEQPKTLTTRHICSLSLFADNQGNLFVRDRGCINSMFVGTYRASVSSCTLKDAVGSYLSICKDANFQAPAKNTLLQLVFTGQKPDTTRATP
jgi:hypothetical protein